MTIRSEHDKSLDKAPDPSELQEQVWGILEDVGMPEAILIKIDKLIGDWEEEEADERGYKASYNSQIRG